MAFSARAPRSHCAWKPENAEQHLSSPQCQVSVGKRRRWHGMSWIWSSGFLNERRQGLQPSAYGLLVTSYLDLDDSDASLVKKKKKCSLFWIIHACRNIIFTLNNEIPTCMISGYSGQLLLDSGFRACVPYFDVMRLKIIILKKCIMYAINYGAAMRGALHLGHFREDGMELNVCKEAASLTRVTCYIERPINQAASSATELSSY